MPRISQMLAGREMYSVDEHRTVLDVARTMAGLHVGAILVLAEGKLRGIFSERDLMQRVVVPGLDPARTLVREVMSTDLATVDAEAAFEEARERMHDHKCRHLPVMRDGTVVGLLSMRDLMDRELAEKTEELEHMRSYIHGAA